MRLRQGRLLGQVHAIGSAGLGDPALLSLEANACDVLGTSAIEGEPLPILQVRSSLARRLSLPIGHTVPAGRNVEAMVSVMLDATRHHAQPLGADRLLRWHAMLFPTGWSVMGPIRAGAWRDGPMQVVSGEMGLPRVHFEAPAPEHVPAEMDAFLQWFNAEADIDPLLKAGLAQLRFLTIHPFEDGNGRLARALTDLLLARAGDGAARCYSLSRRLHLERADYYRELEAAQRGGLDVTPWLRWFLGCLDRALADGEETLQAILAKGRFWAAHGHRALNARQRSVLNRLLERFEGKLTSSKYAKLEGVSQDTALRDLDGMVEAGILRREGEGRGVHYRLCWPV